MAIGGTKGTHASCPDAADDNPSTSILVTAFFDSHVISDFIADPHKRIGDGHTTITSGLIGTSCHDIYPISNISLKFLILTAAYIPAIGNLA